MKVLLQRNVDTRSAAQCRINVVPDMILALKEVVAGRVMSFTRTVVPYSCTERAVEDLPTDRVPRSLFSRE